MFAFPGERRIWICYFSIKCTRVTRKTDLASRIFRPILAITYFYVNPASNYCYNNKRNGHSTDNVIAKHINVRNDRNIVYII